MAEQAELAFVKTFASNLSLQPVVFGDEYQQQPESSLKKVPVLPVDLPPPPEHQRQAAVSTSSITVTFKSVKPAKAFKLSVQPTDTISDIKTQLAAEPAAPPADAQRLLLKGKALADGKLLQEYSVKDGDTVNLMVKPGFEWDPSTISAIPTADQQKLNVTNVDGTTSITLVPSQERKSRMGHTRIPSVVLSPSPSLTPSSDGKLVDIPLVLDASTIPASSSSSGAENSLYHDQLAQPLFWERLYDFLSLQFANQSDAATAWEDFFRASKGTLSVSEIAKIRDQVGVIGMGGT